MNLMCCGNKKYFALMLYRFVFAAGDEKEKGNVN